MRPEFELSWGHDCYFGASAAALARVLRPWGYALAGEDALGATLLFVRSDLLPRGAHAPTLASAPWLAASTRRGRRGALHAPCQRMEALPHPPETRGPAPSQRAPNGPLPSPNPSSLPAVGARGGRGAA
jgi:hypothetical protein